MTDTVLILPDIRSAHNVGALFRTADALGIAKIYLVGITPGPLDRFGRERPDVAKAALGAEKTMAWEMRADIDSLLEELKNEGYMTVAIEQSPESVDYKDVKISAKTAFVLGAEVDGLSDSVLEQCDVVAEIPMQGMLARNRPDGYGGKESLNVSVAAGVALFRMMGK